MMLKDKVAVIYGAGNGWTSDRWANEPVIERINTWFPAGGETMSLGKISLWSAVLTFACVLSPPMTLADTTTNPHVRYAQRPPVTHPLFKFHSNLWVNLHQILLHEALLRAGKADRRLQSATPLSVAGMSAQEEADWNAAVSFYAGQFATRRQHGDDQLIEINDDLAEQPDNGAHLNPAGLSPEMVSVLQRAAVIYRKYWWSAHDGSNEKWIASQEDRVRDLGPTLASEMTEDLQQAWPAEPIRVDVCHYVADIGHAFTILPPHITFSSSDPSTEDLSGFELLFHEASHTFADTLTNALSAEGHMQHKDVGDLWHSVLFYTSGVELRRLLPAPEQAGFTPYAYRYGVYNGGNWPRYRRVLEASWQAYLDGKTDFAEAVHSMVAGLP